MPKNKIFCSKCNEEFNSMTDFDHHICPNESTAPKWGNRIGQNKSKKDPLQQHTENRWLEQAEEIRKKNNKTIHKKKYRRKHT